MRVGIYFKRSIAMPVSRVVVSRVGADAAAPACPTQQSNCNMKDYVSIQLAGLKDVTNPSGAKDDTQQTFW